MSDITSLQLSSLWIKSSSITYNILMKVPKQYFPVVLFYYAVQGGSDF